MHGIELDEVTDPDSLRPGTVLVGGRYTIEHQLGRGGAGTVYIATCNDGSQVAMKIMATKRAGDPDQEQRFLNEAEIVSKLDEHPGLVRTREVGHVPELEQRLYMTMDLVQGPTLSLAIVSSALPALEACEVMRDIADTVAYLHDRGVIHRDIKPTNIMLPQTGAPRPRLLDFGYAFSMGRGDLPSTGGLTHVDHRPGTKHYMSPEQALGYPPAPSFDVYALAATLFQALVGRPPYFSMAPDEAVRRKLDKDKPEPSIRGRRADLPRSLERLVDDGLRRDPVRRIASASEFRDRLDEVIAELRELGPRPVPNFIDVSDDGPSKDATMMMGSAARFAVPLPESTSPLEAPTAGHTLVATSGTEPSGVRDPAREGATEPAQRRAVPPTDGDVAATPLDSSAAGEPQRRAAVSTASAGPAPRSHEQTTKPEPAATSKSDRVDPLPPPPPALRSSAMVIEPTIRQLPTLPAAAPTDPDMLKVVDPSRKWVALAVVMLLLLTVGVGTWLLGGEGNPEVEDRPVGATPELPAKIDHSTPPPKPMKPSSPILSTDSPSSVPSPVQPAAREVEPAKASVKPDVVAPPQSKPVIPKSRGLDDTPSKPSKAERCKKHREETEAAFEGGQWSVVAANTVGKECWPSKDERQHLRIRALYALREYDDCVKAAREHTPPAAARFARACASQTGQEL